MNDYSICTACGESTIGESNRQDHETVRGLFYCKTCGGLLGTIYKGELFGVVKFVWHDPAVDGPEDPRYFDITTLGNNGIDRVHGWYDRLSLKVTQIG